VGLGEAADRATAAHLDYNCAYGDEDEEDEGGYDPCVGIVGEGLVVVVVVNIGICGRGRHVGSALYLYVVMGVLEGFLFIRSLLVRVSFGVVDGSGYGLGRPARWRMEISEIVRESGDERTLAAGDGG
jgi:hypothetical protein